MNVTGAYLKQRLVKGLDQSVTWPSMTLVLAAIIPWTMLRLRRRRKFRRWKSSEKRATSSSFPENIRRPSQSASIVPYDKMPGAKVMLVHALYFQSTLQFSSRINPFACFKVRQSLWLPRILCAYTGTLRPSSLTRAMRRSTGALDVLPHQDACLILYQTTA